MIKKINALLSGWTMTALGGAFLLASFILPRVGVPAGETLAWGPSLFAAYPFVTSPFGESSIIKASARFPPPCSSL